MSYESVVTDLKALLKRELFDIPASEHIDQLLRESERAQMILDGGMIERFLVAALRKKMIGLNAGEIDRLFNFEGPCGSFSNRIKIAQALGIIDRPTRRKLDLIREIRNVAAHAHPDVTFATPEIRAAVLVLIGADYERLMKVSPSYGTRAVYGVFCTAMGAAIAVGPTNTARTMKSLLDQYVAKAGASLGKPARRSPPSRPAKGRTGKRP